MQMAWAGKVDEPPGKKRKLDENDETGVEFWDDDDDLQLTQDQWRNLDNNVDQFMSQHPQAPEDHHNGTKSLGNLGKSPRSLGKGMPKSHSAGNYGHPTPNSSFVQTPTGVLGSAGLPQNRLLQKNHGIPSSNRVLTPKAGSATVSPALPTQARINLPDPVEKYKKELDHYRQEIQSFKTSQYSKDGQITMLKKSLMEKERLLSQLHQEKITQIETQAKEKTEKEKTLEVELDKINTQLQFKEHEIAELQNTCKRLEAKSFGSGSDGGISPRKALPVSPRRSPRGSSPRASQKSNFPNKMTFMEEKQSAERPITKRTKIVFDDSPKPEKDAVQEIRENLLKLNVSNNKGAIPGGMLVTKLLSRPNVLGKTSAASLVTLMASTGDVSSDAESPPVLARRFPISSSQGEDVKLNTSVKLRDSILISQGLNGLLASDYNCSPTVLLLPAIEDQITIFLDYCNRQKNNSSKSSVVARSSRDPKVDQKQSDYELNDENVEPVGNSLSLLLKLATWCGHSRDAILNSQMRSNNSCSLLGVQGTPDNAQNLQNQESESLDLQLMPAHESLNAQNIVKKNKVLNKLVQLARPNLPNGAPQKMEILHTSLKILGQVALQASSDSADSFGKLFTEDILLKCLSPDVREDDEERVLLYISVLDILCPLLKYSKILDRMCAKQGDCLFNAIYTAAGHSLQVQSPNRTVLTQKIMQFINTVLCQHENGCQALLETDCQCAHQVARCVVTILHAELISYQKTGRKEQLRTLRQGISCLQTMSMVDRRGAVGVNDDAEIAQLVYSMERLMKDDKSVSELEIAALQDLWDFFDVEQEEQ